MLNYSLICPILTYGIQMQVWGLTYPTYLKPVTTLICKKRVLRVMTFFEPISHSEPLTPLLKSLSLLKFSDIIHLEILGS